MQHLQLQCRSCHIYQSVSGICLPSGGQKKYPSGKSSRLRRHPSVISRELKRNGYGGNGYVAILASAKAKQRKRRAGLRQPLKYPWLYSHVLERLRWGYAGDNRREIKA